MGTTPIKGLAQALAPSEHGGVVVALLVTVLVMMMKTIVVVVMVITTVMMTTAPASPTVSTTPQPLLPLIALDSPSDAERTCVKVWTRVTQRVV